MQPQDLLREHHAKSRSRTQGSSGIEGNEEAFFFFRCHSAPIINNCDCHIFIGVLNAHEDRDAITRVTRSVVDDISDRLPHQTRVNGHVDGSPMIFKADWCRMEAAKLRNIVPNKFTHFDPLETKVKQIRFHPDFCKHVLRHLDDLVGVFGDRFGEFQLHLVHGASRTISE